ncbi:MAG: hypothetical protein MUC73_07945 [Cyclobacteriaceae bacterium]|nr:hypothetical protein [Cyclobacteriaceae bacterium]
MKNAIVIVFCLFIVQVNAQTELSGKAILGGLRARSIGPAVMSGRISDIEVVKSKPEIIYVGTAGGGVWKSVSGGTTFRPVFDDYAQSIGKVTVDPNNPETVWVGTGEPWVRNSVGVGNGLYKSTNGGTSWEFVGLKDSEHISDIIVHPKDGNIVYVGVQGHLWNSNEERGVFKTTDGGKTWNKILYIDENTGCADMDIDPSNPEVLYAAMWSHRRYPDFFDSGFTGTSGLFKSTDGGKTWNKIHNGLPTAKLGRVGIGVAPSNSSVIYASIEAEGNSNKGLYKSTDAGASWKKINSDFSNTVRPFYFSRITVDPSNENNLIKCAYIPIISTDGGNKFRSMGSPHADLHAAWIDPRNSNHILLGTDGGVYESFDQGYSFRMWPNLPVGQFYHVTTDNEIPYNVYGGLQDNGTWYGPSRQAGGITNHDWMLSYYGDGFYSHRHPSDPDVIYAEYQGGNSVRFNKKTGVSKSIKPMPEKGDPKLRFNWNTPLVQSPNKPDRIYTSSQFLYRSDDRGDTWKKISPDLTTNDPKRQRQNLSGGVSIDNSSAENNATIYAVAESPLDENIVWVGTDDGYVQYTDNQGVNWNNVTKNITGLPIGNWCSYIEPGHFNKNVAYVTFDNHRNGDMKTYIYKTTDMGKTWTSLATPELEGHAYVIREDLKNPDILFLGTEFGLYISINGGKNWNRFENNFPRVPVHDLTIHPREHDLVIATHGRGIYIIDDISPLRQLSADVLASTIHFFDIRPTVLRDPGASGRNPSPGDDAFYGENPNTRAKIVYFMNKRHTFGKMSIEVYDQQDKLVRELPAGKSAGINVVEMVTNYDRPRIPPSDTRESIGGSLVGPNLPAGTYKVKVIKGKEEFNSSFTLAYPDDSPYTAEDRKIKHDATMQLFNLCEELAYIYDAQVDLLKQGSSIKEANPKLAKTLSPWLTDIEKQNNLIAFKGGDFYVATEERLTERVAELFGSVNSYPGRPGNSQLQRIETLKDEINQVRLKFEELSKARLDKINSALAKSKINAIKVKSVEEFRNSPAGGNSGGTQLIELLQYLFLTIR